MVGKKIRFYVNLHTNTLIHCGGISTNQNTCIVSVEGCIGYGGHEGMEEVEDIKGDGGSRGAWRGAEGTDGCGRHRECSGYGGAQRVQREWRGTEGMEWHCRSINNLWLPLGTTF